MGNFSVLIFKFQISREVGYYIMDYFVPSIMLVCTSWVTFWLQADNAAPRITLGKCVSKKKASHFTPNINKEIDKNK